MSTNNLSVWETVNLPSNKKFNACFNGCSLTYGKGLTEKIRKQCNYPGLVAEEYNFNLTNISISGSSNYTIFMRSTEAILSGKYDIIFTQWSALNRHWLSPGPDTYFFLNDENHNDFKYRDFYLSPKETLTFKKTFLVMNHDYQNIFDLVDYCKNLKALADYKSTKIVFINGLVPWKDDLIKSTVNNLETDLSDYTKSILDFDNRDDEEIVLYFNKLKQKFSELDQARWVNLFESFHHNIIDVNSDGHHPGIKSHALMADKISTYLTTNQIL